MCISILYICIIYTYMYIIHTYIHYITFTITVTSTLHYITIHYHAYNTYITHVRTYVRTHARTHARMHAHTDIHTYIHACMHILYIQSMDTIHTGRSGQRVYNLGRRAEEKQRLASGPAGLPNLWCDWRWILEHRGIAKGSEGAWKFFKLLGFIGYPKNSMVSSQQMTNIGVFIFWK